MVPEKQGTPLTQIGLDARSRKPLDDSRRWKGD
jgi:hypothetical protein